MIMITIAIKPALLSVGQITGYATTNEQRIVRSSVFTEKPQHDLEFRGRFSEFPIHRPVLKFQSSLPVTGQGVPVYSAMDIQNGET